jgi:hypothetical protein
VLKACPAFEFTNVIGGVTIVVYALKYPPSPGRGEGKYQPMSFRGKNEKGEEKKEENIKGKGEKTKR